MPTLDNAPNVTSHPTETGRTLVGRAATVGPAQLATDIVSAALARNRCVLTQGYAVGLTAGKSGTRVGLYVESLDLVIELPAGMAAMLYADLHAVMASRPGMRAVLSDVMGADLVEPPPVAEAAFEGSER
jgi:hypothetical protein